MSILSRFFPKKIAMQGKIVRWRHHKSIFAGDDMQRCFLLQDAEGKLFTITCDLTDSPEANLAEIGDTVSFNKYPKGSFAFDLQIVTAANEQEASENRNQ